MERPQAENDAQTGAEPVLDRALALVRFLRANCPWDAAQTPASLVPFLLEEAHEVAEAVGDRNIRELPGELGDLLLNVAFQIVIAEEQSSFSADDVVGALERKMRARHPHLYGDGPREEWEALKARERQAGAGAGAGSGSGTEGRHQGQFQGQEQQQQKQQQQQPPAGSILSDVPRGLDALSRAHKIQERVARVGFDWAEARGAFDKVLEEVEEVREHLGVADSAEMREELGDLLFAVVNLSRLAGVHPVEALQAANLKFTARFESLERLAHERGMRMEACSLEELDALWDEVKRGTA